MLKFDEEKHIYSNNGVIYPSVTQIIGKALGDQFKSVDKDLLKYKGEFGTAGHLTLKLHDEDNLKECPNEFKPHLKHWIDFIKTYKVSFELIEKPLCDHNLGYAGTLDRVAKIGQDLILIDIKFGSFMPSFALQTAGYSALYLKNTGKRIKKRFAVRLTSSGFEIKEYKNMSDESVFMGMLNSYRWQKQNGLL